jgi:hypothetical protein
MSLTLTVIDPIRRLSDITKLQRTWTCLASCVFDVFSRMTPQLTPVPPYGYARVDQPDWTTLIFGGRTPPMTVSVRVARPAPEQVAVTCVTPGCTRFGTVQVHVAVPPAAVTAFRPFCLAPLLYRTAREQRAPAGETVTETVAGLPWTTRDGPATKATAWARPLAAPAETVTPTTIARAKGRRRFVVPVAVMSSGGVPRRHFLFRSVPEGALPLG